MKQGIIQSPDLLEIYFKERFSKRNLGVLEGANHTADERTCRGGRDHLFLYMKIKGDVIDDISFECGGCDKAMFVAGDILCNLVRGRSFNELLIYEGEFFNALGGECKEGLEHFNMAMKILKEGIQNYRKIQNKEGYKI